MQMRKCEMRMLESEAQYMNSVHHNSKASVRSRAGAIIKKQRYGSRTSKERERLSANIVAQVYQIRASARDNPNQRAQMRAHVHSCSTTQEWLTRIRTTAACA